MRFPRIGGRQFLLFCEYDVASLDPAENTNLSSIYLDLVLERLELMLLRKNLLTLYIVPPGASGKFQIPFFQGDRCSFLSNFVK